MKIVNITFNNARGGVEQVFVDYTDVLQKQGHEVIPLICYNSKFLPDLKKVSAKIYFSKYLRTKYLRPFLFLELKEIFRKLKPELVIFHNDRNLHIVKYAAGSLCPVVAINHGCKIVNMLKADHIFTVNSAIAKELGNKGYDPQKITVINNMIKI